MPAALLLCGITLSTAPAPLEIPLTVEEPAGVARRQEPVTGGIPLPRGQIAVNQGFSLLAGDREIPLQTTPLVVERDGSRRWVLVDFQLDVGPREVRHLTLRARTATARPERTIQISEDAAGVTIDTGPLRARIAKTGPFSLFAEVRIGGEPVVSGGGADLVLAETGERLQAAPPRRVTFEYRGPLRATLRLDGEYRREPAKAGNGQEDGNPSYTTRLTFWAGKTTVRVEHLLANSNRRRVEHLKIERASLLVRHLLGPGARGEAGPVEGALTAGSTVWLHQGLLPRSGGAAAAGAARAGSGSRVEWTGSEAAGWIAARRDGTALFACDRDFAGDPPRRLEVASDRLLLEYASVPFAGERGAPCRSDRLWLHDCSHRTAEVWIDFAARGDLESRARACRSRLLAFAPGEWYSRCDVLGSGRFGTLEDEKETYRKWGWKFDDRQLPRSAPAPGAYVRWEDNHYESEADSAEALLLMALRTGERGFFDHGEAWARYHANLQAWRTDGWVWDDGAIWFPQGGPQGTRRERLPPKRQYKMWDQGGGDDQELWHQAQAKACYCHFYGAGLVDHFLLTGARDSLEAAVDLAEVKDSEFRKHRKFTPGETTISDTRGFGRGFYVVTHLLEALPESAFLQGLAQLCRDVLWKAPDLDERGFAPCHIGTGFGGFDLERDLPPEMRTVMAAEGIEIDGKGWLSDRAGNRWPVVCLGGTWQHAYVAAAAYRYWEVLGDEDMADFACGFGRFAARFLLSEKCHQTHYYAYMDVPHKGEAWDPWKVQAEHTATRDGEGCVHSGWYTRFLPDAVTVAYRLSGEEKLLERARTFWHYGSKRRYRTKGLFAGPLEVGTFASHTPPKDDSVLSTCRMFHDWAHPRKDAEGPEAVRDLEVLVLEDGRARVRFTAPQDQGGGRVARYQLKWAALPIVSYNEYDFARDHGRRRNFWRAANVTGEPAPAPPGEREELTVEPLPAGGPLHFALASYDGAGNRSALALARARRP